MSTDWSDLYRSTFPDLVRFLHRKVWDRERARDLAQECFVRALRDEPDRPRAWLFTVAANLARDEARTVIRRKKHLALLKGEVAGRTAPDDPARELAERERMERLREALDALGERDREVLLLWDAGLNYMEISETTGLAVGAIGTTLARARKRLVAAFETIEGDHAARS
ncbi:MAG: sigma-70 family RNA polymerase sigma factor [Gemmatimonadota bacterium]